MGSVKLKIGKLIIEPYILLVLVAFCVIYALSIINLLPATYFTGTSYEKFFSLDIFIVCIIDAIILYFITEYTVSKGNKIQAYTIRFVYWIYAIPMSLYPSLFAPKYVWMFWISFNVYWIFLCIITSKYYTFRIGVKFKSGLKISNKIKKWVGIASIIIIIYTIMRQLNGYEFSLTLDGLYEVRENFKDQMSQNFIGIFKNIFGTYICPCLIVAFIKEKKILYSICFSFLQLIIFTLAKDKIMLFYLMMAVVIGFASNKIYRDINKYISWGIIAICFMLILALNDYFTLLTFTLVVRRMFMMTTWGNYLWFEFFTDNSKLWLHQDVFLIDVFFSPIYHAPAPAIIANSIGGGEYSYFNVGMMAESYAQMGFLGFIISPIILGWWLNIINRYYKNKSDAIVLMLSFSISQAIINSTIIETANIIIFLMIVVYSVVYPRSKKATIHQ